MQTRYYGEISAMLLVSGSALLLIHLDSQGFLSCVPLLVGLYAIHRGATWAAFAVLAGASGLLTLAMAGQAPWLLSIGASAAILPTLVVLPSLWRFDRQATHILTGLALALGIAGALLFHSGERPVTFEPETRPVATEPAVVEECKPTVSEIVEILERAEEPGGCVAADLVGIYDADENAAGSLRLDAEHGFVRTLGDGSETYGTFSVDERGVVLTTTDGHIERIGCKAEQQGRSTLDGHTVWEVAR